MTNSTASSADSFIRNSSLGAMTNRIGEAMGEIVLTSTNEGLYLSYGGGNIPVVKRVEIQFNWDNTVENVWFSKKSVTRILYDANLIKPAKPSAEELREAKLKRKEELLKELEKVNLDESY